MSQVRTLKSNVLGFRPDTPIREQYTDEELLKYELDRTGFGSRISGGAETDDVLFTLDVPLDQALVAVQRVIAADTKPVDFQDDARMPRFRAVVPAGTWESDPAVVRVTLRAKHAHATIVNVEAKSRRVTFGAETCQKVTNRLARYIAVEASGT